MAWEPLSKRFSKVPLILAGPILRRTEPDNVTVWVALKEKRNVKLKIIAVDAADDAPLLSGMRDTVKLGDHLHVAAVTAFQVGEKKLTPGNNYHYNLELGNDEDLTSPNFFSKPITYRNDSLPSFSLPPPDLNKLRIVHASCRKPHGENFDALAILDDIINKDAGNPLSRPHQLFLTGDQIYADDVADVMLFMLRDALGENAEPEGWNGILGWSETLPDVEDENDLMPGKRSDLVTDVAGASSGAAKSHLLKLGEYYAMNLFAWSDTLWPRDLTTEIDVFGSASGNLKAILDFLLQWSHLKKFKEALPKVRRALANVPTYMIFDDHEITDDWFLNFRWCKNVLTTNLGRRLIQNGLSTYAVFQAWGNTPAEFDESKPGGALLKLLEVWQGRDENLSSPIAHLVGLPSDDTEAATFITEIRNDKQLSHVGDQPWHGSIDWHYNVAASSHEVIVLDTRTWRAFPGLRLGSVHDPISSFFSRRSERTFPALLSKEAFAEQFKHISGVGGISVIISPAPFVGVSTIEDKLKLVGSIFKIWDRLIDAEAWIYQQVAFERFLAAAVEKKDKHRFVILSGDVHYSFASRLQYWAARTFESDSGPASPEKMMIIAQLTASSLKNETRTGFPQFRRTYHWHKRGYGREGGPPKLEFFVWNNANKERRTIGTRKVRSARFILPTPWRLPRENPALINLTEDRKNSAGLIIKSVAELPDWRYRVDYILSDAEFDARSCEPKAVEPPSTNDKEQALGSFNDVAVNVEKCGQKASDGREIVGVNNIAEVRFDWPETGDKTVRQILLWRLEEERFPLTFLEPTPLTEYVLSLEFDNPKFPRPDVPIGE